MLPQYFGTLEWQQATEIDYVTHDSHHTSTQDDFNWDDAYSGELSDYVGPDSKLLNIVESLPTGTALDLGCGAGGLVVALVERGWNVTGVDIAKNAIVSARKRLNGMGLEADLQVADSGDWRPDKEFDLAISSFALPGREARATTLQTLSESVRPGGSVLVKEFDSQMNGVMASDLPTLEELKSAFAGFEFAKAEIVNTPSHDHGSSGGHSADWTAILIQAIKPLK